MQALAASLTSKSRVHLRVPATPAASRLMKQIDVTIKRKLKPYECGYIKGTMDAVFRGYKYYEEVMVDPPLQWVTKVKVGSSAEAEPGSTTKKTDNDLDEVEYEDSGKYLETREI